MATTSTQALVDDGHIDLEGCRLMQKEEFEVLESIYPEYISSQTQEATLRLEVPIELGSSTSVIISEPRSPQPSANGLLAKKSTVQTVTLAVLPPLLLNITLPPSYPLFDPPQIISIRATHVWLPNATLLLREALLEMWQAGEPVIYNWIEYIRTGEFLAKLNLRTPSHDDLVLRTWHGPLDKCPIAQYEDLALEYINAKEGSTARATLERRFGKANILRLVATYREEKANLEWFKSSTTMCPGCRCYIEKTMGCNHMTCWKCSQHFCYRCGDRLNPDHPYTHFSNALTPCYNQLFDVIDVDPEDWEPIVD
ncbi:hypothetical protein NLJ89_g5962 [Agrocybe chaxingu]|uniref:Uncharacterized protein n=1 Tax=Agrocybe chaxingu TaxID=84603 RepID=A0A9W8MUI9_9AGAR|nr:hypothetical protein NLJ89_g5962 [Agrocybe chaxingu]